MNREIKFRAWQSQEKKMYHQGDTCDENRSHFWKIWENKSHISNPMQFTGIEDKNGKEIYEGDINQDSGILIWNIDDASFCWEYKELEVHSMGSENEWCLIIGNIHENPELIK
ncbi:MAG: YopX family protein [Ferruginibacter sp.]